MGIWKIPASQLKQQSSVVYLITLEIKKKNRKRRTHGSLYHALLLKTKQNSILYIIKTRDESGYCSVHLPDHVILTLLRMR